MSEKVYKIKLMVDSRVVFGDYDNDLEVLLEPSVVRLCASEMINLLKQTVDLVNEIKENNHMNGSEDEGRHFSDFMRSVGSLHGSFYIVDHDGGFLWDPIVRGSVKKIYGSEDTVAVELLRAEEKIKNRMRIEDIYWINSKVGTDSSSERLNLIDEWEVNIETDDIIELSGACEGLIPLLDIINKGKGVRNAC